MRKIVGMKTHYGKMKKLFLKQSCMDSWADYERSISKEGFITWDYVIITASNEEQAKNYREQIAYRLKNDMLPHKIHYAVLPDPEGKRVGSGGATFNVLRYIKEQNCDCENPFKEKRILVIHSGGDSKRIPQYSVSGKLFSPVPRELPNGYASTLFDEFIIAMSGVPSRIREGMLILSGDVLLLFNPLQIDTQFRGAAALSFKESSELGANHGVYLNDGNDYVGKFLHKQTEETLKSVGAVDERGKVDLDTGAILFDAEILMALLGLLMEDNNISEEKFQQFVNEEARVSFYGDFLYPLAASSTLQEYYMEKPEGELTEELLLCREKIWHALKNFQMKLLCLSPAEFIHFGTTNELQNLLTNEIEEYEFLEWNKHICSTSEFGDFASNNSYIGKKVEIGKGCYIENSFVLGETVIKDNSIVSSVYLRNVSIPENVVLHGIELKDEKYVVRIYGTQDNPKDLFEVDAVFLGNNVNKIAPYLNEYLGKVTFWDLPIYAIEDTMHRAVEMSLVLYRIMRGTATEEEIREWRVKKKHSLNSSFNNACIEKICFTQRTIRSRVLVNRFVNELENGSYYKNALAVFGEQGITEEIYKELIKDADEAEPWLKTRIYYALSRYMKQAKKTFGDYSYDKYENLCFNTIAKRVFANTKNEKSLKKLSIFEESVDVELPVRVNWGGGWSDTPPYCIEHGGTVLNATLKLNGIFPIRVSIRRIEEYVIEFASEDVGVYGKVEELTEILNCNNPYDSFALHKAALIACGVVQETQNETLEDLLKRIGGGIYLSTQVIGIPKGSGLGTSSILSAACVKAIYKFFDIEIDQQRLIETVSHMEQLMSTGGGWQDQAGGLIKGIKLFSTCPGEKQELKVEMIRLKDETKMELQERFALIYTGQRRLARNLLRDVVGNYVGGREETLYALKKIQEIAVLMRYELERGDIDAFAKLLTEHWEVSKLLDGGTTNTCIEQIFISCEDLIEGRFIAGAGGGGFLQVILKKGVSKQQLNSRLKDVFQDSGVAVWDTEFEW